MAKSEHQKHTNLTKPDYGFFGRNEWSIIGTTCENIQQLAYQIIAELSKDYQVGYVDADHKGENEEQKSQNALSHNASLEYIDKIAFHRFDKKTTLNSFQYHQIFNEQDLVLVNGNHFSAKRQIVVVDPKKEQSLQKKLDRLTQVDLILLTEDAPAIPDFLGFHLPYLDSIPIFHLKDVKYVIRFLKEQLKEQIPPLYGLVLTGGKSQRMGQDKGLIDYHGKPQKFYIADILSNLCKKTYLSVRTSEGNLDAQGYEFLEDTFTGLGPFGAIASAFRAHPNAAWLVVACDLPVLDSATLEFLIKNRNPSALATAFNSPVNEFPEPLICIWEPKSYSVLLQFLVQGYSCPRKVLINSQVHLLDAPDGNKLMNVNSPEEMEAAIKMIGKI